MLKYILGILIGTLMLIKPVQSQVIANAAHIFDQRSILINPATVAHQSDPQLFAGYHLMHVGMLTESFRNGYLGLIYPLRNRVFSLTGQYFSAHLFNRNYLNFGCGQKLWNDRLAVGIHLGLLGVAYEREKFAPEDLNDPLLNNKTSKMTVNLGIGILTQLHSKLFVGLGLDHLNRPDLSLEDSGWKMPVRLNLGLLYRHALVTPLFNFEQDEQRTYFQLGAERYWLHNQLMSRLLYARETLRLAAGYHYKNLRFDYAYQYPLSDLSEVSTGCHEFMVSYALASKIPDFKISITPLPSQLPASLTRQPGDSIVYLITILPENDFQEDIKLTLKNVPPEITPLLDTDHLRPGTDTRLWLIIGAGCKPGNYRLRLNGVAEVLQQQKTIEFRVSQPLEPEMLPVVHSSVDTIVLEQHEVREEFPLLPVIFFEKNQARLLAERYYLRPDTNSTLSQQTNQLEIYQNILNIIGQRLATQPDKKIKLIGRYSNQHRGSKRLAFSRASAIRDYWVKQWKVAPSQIYLQTQPLTVRADTKNLLLQEEQQRVELEPQPGSASVFEPIVTTSRVVHSIDSVLVFSTDLTFNEMPIKSWELTITNSGGETIRRFAEPAPLPVEIEWKLGVDSLMILRENSFLSYQLILTDTTNQQHQSKVGKTWIEKRVTTRSRQFRKFRLILFEFAQAGVDLNSPILKHQLAQIVAQVKPAANIKLVLRGYTDTTGPQALNQRLSQQRARAIFEELVKLGIPPERITYAGLGEQNPLMTNELPEGRMLNRRVEIFWEVPK